MTVFISHAFDNQDEFYNIADALEQAEIPYWNPKEVQPGSSLRDQLRQAVGKSNVCVFIATHLALKSSWCGAELGAFWGAGKPVIVYLAEASLQKDSLPPIVQGDVWEGRIARVVARASELVNEARSAAEETSNRGSTHVGAMTVEQFEDLIVGAISLAAATTKSKGGGTTPEEISRVAKGTTDSLVEGIKATERTAHSFDEDWRKHILWVDDRPDNNAYERRAFESMGIKFTLALSTREALDILSKKRFGAIISDMGRKEGPREGYALLDTIRTNGDRTPFFIYAASNAPKHKREAAEHGGQGSTNSPQELFAMVTHALGSEDVA